MGKELKLPLGAAIRESFRISETDRRARMGVLRRVIGNLGKIGLALFALWMMGQTAIFPPQNFADFSENMFWLTVVFWSLGFFLCALFVRVEMDKRGIVSFTHSAGKWGGWFYVAGVAPLAMVAGTFAFDLLF